MISTPYIFRQVGLILFTITLFIKSINGVRRMEVGYNPATWVLEVTASAQEELLGIKFSSVYRKSELHRFVRSNSCHCVNP